MNEAPWALAIADVARDRPLNIIAACAEEVMVLWTDLDDAIRNTIRTCRSDENAWSVGALGIAVRIVHLSRFTGATPWTQVPMNRVLDGTWHGLLAAAGIPHTGPTAEERAELERMHEECRGGYRPAGYQPRQDGFKDHM